MKDQTTKSPKLLTKRQPKIKRAWLVLRQVGREVNRQWKSKTPSWEVLSGLRK